MTITRDLLQQCAAILDNPYNHVWTTQGFGMIRTYLDPETKRFRLNVWDHRLRNPAVSDIHDHPWDFTSTVLVGRLMNVRFQEHAPDMPAPAHALPFRHVEIKTGEGGGPVDRAPDRRWLTAKPAEMYRTGQSYHQPRQEIHQTGFQDGTVTLNDRSPATPEHTANIYWPRGPWVDAEPRLATRAEIANAIEQARELARMEKHSGP